MLCIGSTSCIECPDHHWIVDMTTSHREYIEKHGRPSDELVQEVVRRIVEVANPTGSSCSVRVPEGTWGNIQTWTF